MDMNGCVVVSRHITTTVQDPYNHRGPIRLNSSLLTCWVHGFIKLSPFLYAYIRRNTIGDETYQTSQRISSHQQSNSVFTLSRSMRKSKFHRYLGDTMSRKALSHASLNNIWVGLFLRKSIAIRQFARSHLLTPQHWNPRQFHSWNGCITSSPPPYTPLPCRVHAGNYLQNYVRY